MPMTPEQLKMEALMEALRIACIILGSALSLILTGLVIFWGWLVKRQNSSDKKINEILQNQAGKHEMILTLRRDVDSMGEKVNRHERVLAGFRSRDDHDSR